MSFGSKQMVKIAGKSNSKYTLMAILVVGVAVIGTVYFLVTHAQTPTASVYVSSGSISGCANAVTDSKASNGKAVKFQPCPVPVVGPVSNDPTQLDASGNTIPDTNYSIPGGAIYMATNGNDFNSGSSSSPVLTLNKAVSLVASGGTIVVRGGTYRDWYNSGGTTFGSISKTVTIQAYPHEKPWFDGTNVVSANWTSDGSGHWYQSWKTPSFCSNGYYSLPYTAQNTNDQGPCSHYDMYYSSSSSSVKTAAGDPQMVYINGNQQHEVTSLSAATSGNFYYDWSNQRIYIASNPSGATVELAARPVAFVNTASGSKILGIGFKRFASNEYNNSTEGAVYMGGSNTVVENSVFTLNAGGGLGLSNPTSDLVNHSIFAFNGFDGVESNGHQHSSGAADNIIIQNNVFNNNNTEGFGYFCSASCSQAGIKLAHMDGFTFKNNIVSNNVNAEGFWCDLACTNGIMVNNIVHDNGKAGIMYEVSDTGIIASNLVYNSGAYGIRVAAANTKVYNNTIYNTNGVDLWVYDDARSYGVGGWTDVGPNTSNVAVANNIMTLNVANIIFWALGSSASQTNPGNANFFSTVDYNSYWRNNESTPIYKWQNNDSTISYYPSGSQMAPSGRDANAKYFTGSSDPFFVNSAGKNFNIRSDSSALASSTALPADVQKVLGLSSSTGFNRGAISWPGK